MAFHHVAVATNDLDATHRFYTEAMGFELAKVEVAGTETPEGWAKHAFYDTKGQGMLAFWELHDDSIPEFDAALSTSHGLPTWVNHLAFDAETAEQLAVCRDRWLDHGIDVAEIDHKWCISIYATDPNGTLVEWCLTTAEFTDADRRTALAMLADEAPPRGEAPEVVFHSARR